MSEGLVIHFNVPDRAKVLLRMIHAIRKDDVGDLNGDKLFNYIDKLTDEVLFYREKIEEIQDQYRENKTDILHPLDFLQPQGGQS